MQKACCARPDAFATTPLLKHFRPCVAWIRRYRFSPAGMNWPGHEPFLSPMLFSRTGRSQVGNNVSRVLPGPQNSESSFQRALHYRCTVDVASGVRELHLLQRSVGGIDLGPLTFNSRVVLASEQLRGGSCEIGVGEGASSLGPCMVFRSAEPFH